MKKIPWGIIAGICFIVAFYLTVGIIAADLIISAIAAQTNNVTTIFDSWWQILLFVVDVIAAIGLLGAFVMWLLQKNKCNKKEVTQQ